MSKRVFVAGHRGMVGSAIVRKLELTDSCEVVVAGRDALDLTKQADVCEFFLSENIDEVYLAAAKVGGIHANNQYPADFIYENLMIQTNVVHAAHISGVQRLLFLGSSCIYPKHAPQPIAETALLSGRLEPTNEPYAIAKIAGLKLCESYNRQFGRDYRSVMPTNLYGPNDNFHAQNSHVIPALIRRFHTAVVERQDEVIVWGTGKAMREFLYVDDMARACIYVMQLDKEVYAAHTDPMLSHVNVGTGTDCTISELTKLVSTVTGFSGRVTFDKSKPDGTPKKLLDVSRLQSLGWQATVELQDGLARTYDWYLNNPKYSRT